MPLPALVLRLSTATDPEKPHHWRVVACQPGEHPVTTQATVPNPLHSTPGFKQALASFQTLATRALETKAEEATLHHAAALLGDALAAVLPAAERTRLAQLGHGDGLPPFVIIESAEESILSLPWELLRLENTYPVKAGRLDVARCFPNDHGATLAPPTGPLHLLLHVSAPADSGLRYEAESHRIYRAVREHARVTVNDMGELHDLLGHLAAEAPPTAVHFSGHGGAGALQFEDEFGDQLNVQTTDFLTAARAARPRQWPKLFYLGCCHGHTPSAPATADGAQATSTAALLHRDGFAQVVAHYGLVYDTLATSAEEAFYAKLAVGRRTREAIGAARRVLADPATMPVHEGRRHGGPEALTGGPVPFAWALLVLYHRGLDHPLAPPGEARPAPADSGLQREVREVGAKKNEELVHGFIGRRRQLHRLRRERRGDARQGLPPKNVFVVHGLGGLGKSVFCQIARKVLDPSGQATINLWCREVEDHPQPVSGLLDQFLSAVDAWKLAGWSEFVAQANRQTGDPAELLLRLLSVLAHHWPQLRPKDAPDHLLLHLDNLESLTRPPGTAQQQAEDENPDSLAPWRDDACRRLWLGLTQLAEKSAGQLLLLASTRYCNDDLAPADRFPFQPMPADALERLMDWFPSLHPLSRFTRARLLPELAGHPFAVSYLATLVGDRRKQRRTPLPTAQTAAEAEIEWRELIAPVLAACHGKLKTHLLFEQVWQHVLLPGDRRLLVRLTILRRPADEAAVRELADGLPETAFARLLDTGLLTEHLEPRQPPRFDIHPHVARLAEPLAGADWAAWRAEGTRLAAQCFARRARSSSQVTDDDWDAGHYLLDAGDADGAFGFLGLFVQHFLEQGRGLLARDLLGRFADRQGRPRLAEASQGPWWGLTGETCATLGDLAGALGACRESLAVRQRLAAADPSNAGWQRDLSVSQNKLGDVLRAQGDLAGALGAYRESLAVRQRLAAADPSNAGW